MVQFDNKNGQIKIKIVYFGPALGGKTTCLRSIHRTLDPDRRTTLFSLNTASDRTLFFDLLSLNLGQIRGYSLLTQLYTVPGQVQYATTRKTVLAGADSVVFVADSDPSRLEQNLESLEDLQVNLEADGLNRGKTPIIFQFNKRDLKQALPVSRMNAALNPDGKPSFPSVAVTGEGVMEAFSWVCQDTLRSVAGRMGIGSSQAAVDRLIHQAEKALMPFLGRQDLQVPTGQDHEFTIRDAEGSGRPETDVHLVAAAVRANLAMAEHSALLEDRSRRREEQVADEDQDTSNNRDDVGKESDRENERIRELEQSYQELKQSQAIFEQVILRLAALGGADTTGLAVADTARTAADLLPLLTVDSPLNFMEEAIEGLINRAVAPLRERAAAKDLQLQISLPDGNPAVFCDRAIFSQALNAVVENAVGFSSQGGQVTLEAMRLTRNGSPWFIFRVADVGFGVAEDEVTKVFDPFWQGQNRVDDRISGLGLGLTAAHKAMHSHKGTLTFNSRKGRGTEVILGLPERQPPTENRPLGDGAAR